MLLSGHEGEVYCCKFHPNGNTLASAGFDRLIREYQAPLFPPALHRAGVISGRCTVMGFYVSHGACWVLRVRCFTRRGAGSFFQLLWQVTVLLALRWGW